MSNIPPPGGPPQYGYPHPPAPGAFTYVPTPVMMPVYPPPQSDNPAQPTYVTNYYYPTPPQPQAPPEPVIVVNDPGPVIDWVPSTPPTAGNLAGRAVVAGKEGWDSSPLWIIRAHHNGDFVPGKLAVTHRSAYIPFAGKEVPVHNFEVLCAPTYAVRWVPESNGRVPAGAIPAGNTHRAEPLFIGRVPHMRSITPGKIHPSHGCCYISFSGGEVSFKSYEVLCKMWCATGKYFRCFKYINDLLENNPHQRVLYADEVNVLIQAYNKNYLNKEAN